MSFTAGFNNGFGLVNGVMQQNRNNERQTMLDEREQARYKEGLAYRQSQADQSQANADRSFGFQEDQAMLNRQDVQWNQDNAMLDREDTADQREFQNKNETKRLSIAEQQAQRQSELVKLQMKDANNKLAKQYLDQYAISGEIDEEGKKAIGQSAFAGTYNRMSSIKSDALNVLNGYNNIESPEQLLQFANSPKTLNVVNASMRQEIYAREKATGNDYEIVALEPAAGGVIPIFKITDKEGKVVTQKAPATSGRSNGKDEKVMVVPVSDLKQKIVESFRFTDYVDSDPILKSVFQTKEKQNDIVSTKHGLYNKQTKKFEYKSNDARTEYLQKSLASIDQQLKNDDLMSDQEKASLISERNKILMEWNALTSNGGSKPKPSAAPSNDDPLGLGL